MTRGFVVDTERSSRGLPHFTFQPPQDWLKAHRHFSYRTNEGVRITFHKRHREGRSPTWNGTVCRRGKTFTQYAGTSKTFDVDKVVAYIHRTLREAGYLDK